MPVGTGIKPNRARFRSWLNKWKFNGMSRSKHTDPRLIRATRRIQAPFEPRSAGDLSLRRKLGQIVRELNGVNMAGNGVEPPKLHLRIITRQPNVGFHHPVGKNDV